MKKLSLILLLTIISKTAFSENIKDSFYFGIDAGKNNEAIGKIDNSTANIAKEDSYYGYKFGKDGFFLAPEVSMEKSGSHLNKSGFGNHNQNSNQTNVNDSKSYNLKANIGYDFNKNLSGFLTYDVAKFSYNSNQGATGINVNSVLGNSAIGIGSQINFSNDFGVKILYSQQKFDSNNASSGQIRSDIIKVGTVYSF